MKIYSPSKQIILDSVDDKSYRYRTIMGQHNITVYVSKADALRISIGSYLDFQGIRYTLERPENIKKNNTRNLDYTIIFESPQAKLSKYKVRNTVDKRLKFPYTARPKEHLQLIVDNLNMRDSGWAIGECIDAVESLVSYNHTYCSDALKSVADTFNTEWEIESKTIHLRKVEYNKNTPLALAYGIGNGFKTGVTRTNVDSSKPIEVLYTQGGERNIDFSKYKSNELLLPKNQRIGFDGVYFEDQEGFNPDNARYYKTDAEGYSITRADKELKTHEEDSFDCSNIYPSRVGTITSFQVDAKGNYDIFDTTIPENLDFSKYRIDGEKMTVIFQDKMLVSKEFDIIQTDNKVTGYIHSQRKFQLVSQEYDGQTMPNNIFFPQIGGKYAVFGMMLPDEYICDNATKTGASWDMFREGIKYFFENEEPKFAFTGELNGIWAKSDWLNIGGQIVLGGYVSFTDDQMVDEQANESNNVLIRITGIKDYLNDPYAPEITLANVMAATYNSEFRKIEKNEVVAETQNKNTVNYVKRSWRDTQQLIEAVKGMVDDFEQAELSADVFKGMIGLFGSESLQFQFLSQDWQTAITPFINFNPQTKQLTCGGANIQHMTLGVDSVQPERAITKYKFWKAPQYISPILSEADQPYFLYLKASKDFQFVDGRNIGKANFFVSTEKIKLEDQDGYDTLWVGYLNSENMEGDRSFRTMYGYTEVLPGQITVDKLLSTSGALVIDLLNGIISAKDGATIQGNIKFLSTNGDYQNIGEEFDKTNNKIDDIQLGTINLIRNSKKNETSSNYGFASIAGQRLEKGQTYTFSINGHVDQQALTDKKGLRSFIYTTDPSGAWTWSINRYIDSLEDMTTSITFTYTGETTDRAAISSYLHPGGGGRTGKATLNWYKLVRGNKTSPEWSPAPEDVENNINNLNSYVDGAFRDSVIDGAEAKAIEKYLNTLEETMSQVEATYNKLYANSYLEAGAKTNLLNAKINLFGARDNLKKAINNAIAKGSTTPAQKADVDAKFSAFNSYLKMFQNAVEDANRSIQNRLDALSTSKVDKALNSNETGNINLLNGTASFTQGDIVPNYAGWGTALDLLFRGNFVMKINSAWNGFRLPNFPNNKMDQACVLSFYARVDSGSTTFASITQAGLSITVNSTEWQQYSVRVPAGFVVNNAQRQGILETTTANPVYYSSIQLEKGLYVSPWKPSFLDSLDLNYIKTALANRTEIDGGLLLTSLLKLGTFSGNNFNEKAGINGTAKNANDVIAWFGGTLQQAIQNLASIVFRMDGSGQLAKGNIKWDTIGNLVVKGKYQSATTGQRFIIDPDLGELLMYDDKNNIRASILVDSERNPQITLYGLDGTRTAIRDNLIDLLGGALVVQSNYINFRYLPTNKANLDRGRLWRDGEVVKVVI